MIYGYTSLSNREIKDMVTKRSEQRIRRMLRKVGMFLRKKPEPQETDGGYMIVDGNETPVCGAGYSMELNDVLRYALDVYADWKKDQR